MQAKPGQLVLIPRADGEITPFNAGDALAAALDVHRMPIPRQWRPRLGKAAKELLEDGFDPQTVCASLYAAMRKARPDLAPQFAAEIQAAKAGQVWSWREWNQGLNRISREQRIAEDPKLAAIYQILYEEDK